MENQYIPGNDNEQRSNAEASPADNAATNEATAKKWGWKHRLANMLTGDYILNAERIPLLENEIEEQKSISQQLLDEKHLLAEQVESTLKTLDDNKIRLIDAIDQLNKSQVELTAWRNNCAEILSALHQSHPDLGVSLPGAEVSSSYVMNIVKDNDRRLTSRITELEQQLADAEKVIARQREEALKPKSAEPAKESTAALTPEAFAAKAEAITDLLADVTSSVKEIYPAADRSAPIAAVIDEKIINNDFYGLDEFAKSLANAIQSAEGGDEDALRKAVRDAFTECLDITSATWLDNLARLHCYVSVPFIHEQLAARQVNVHAIESAYSLLEALLRRVGIKLLCPTLFADKFDADNHLAEPIKNIANLVSDFASHVTDEEQLVDLYGVGYQIDNKTIVKPSVSRLNR